MSERVLDRTSGGAAGRGGDERARMDALRSYDLSRDSDETFDRIVRLTADRLGCATAFVSIVETEDQWTKAAWGAPTQRRARTQSLCARAMEMDDVVVVTDPAADPEWRDLAELPENMGIRFYASAPLRTEDGHLIGTLCVADSRPHAFGEAEKQALRDLAAITMDALSLRQALRQSDRVQMRLAQSEARTRAILDTAVDAIITIGPDGIIQSANRAAETLFGYRTAEMMGENVSMLMPEPHASAHDGYLTRYLRQGGPRIIGIGREVPCRRADGSIFPAELAVSESRGEDGPIFTGILRDLSQRKQVEGRLREHIDLVGLVEKAARLGHWRFDLGREDLYWSEEIYRIHGLDPDSFRPTVSAALAFYRPDDRGKLEDALQQAIAGGRGFDLELVLRRGDGAERMVHTHGSAQTDEAGNVVALVGTFQDVTDRVTIEQELARSRERLERSTTYTNIGIWEWDVAQGHLWWSERIAPMMGIGEGAVATRYEAFVEAVHPDDRQALQDAVTAALDGSAPYEIEHRVVWPDGTVRWMQERGAVERDDSGQALRMLGVVQDVTRAKEAELALKESERLLADSIENISDGFVLMDDRDRLVLWNRRLEEIFPKLVPYLKVGAAFADVVRAGAADGQYADAVGRVDDWLAERMARHGKPEENCEEQVEGGRWVRIAERRMANGWRVGIRTDVTEIRRAQQEAQTANRAKSDFLSKMSHELRTPLNAILGFAQLLQVSRKDPLSGTQHRHVGHILDAGHHLLELINEILDLARIEAGRLPLSIEAADPGAIAEDCLGMARTLAAPRDITVTADLGDGALPPVLADTTRLRQVLLNLLSNAVKYNHEGGRVELAISRRGDRLRFSVRDDGPGLSPEAQDRIFEPFNRLGAEASGIEGAGIGLTITRQLVELMEGTIGVDSHPGAGATFWVDLPVADDKGEAR